MSLNALDFTVCYDLTKVHSNSADYHESKMVMTPQRLLCTLEGSGSGEESKSLIVSIKIYNVPSIFITCY